MPNIFEERKALKPEEYPEALEFMRAIRTSMWFIDEFRESLQRDVSDYNYNLTSTEQGILRRSLLAISQIEVSVKEFWTKIGDRLPKPEIKKAGVTIGHNEVIHEEAYSELLTLLDLDDEFAKILEVPCIQGRIDYLTKYLKGASDNKDENYTLTLILFAAFIESCSLFSQFYIIKAMATRKSKLKTIDNIIMATAKEEDVHFQFGVYLTNIIKAENPSWFGDKFKAKIRRACIKAYDAEVAIIDWILGEEEVDFITKEEVVNFLKDRFNKSLIALEVEPEFEVNEELLGEASEWFEEERVLDIRVDFFDRHSPNYTVGAQEFSPETLF